MVAQAWSRLQAMVSPESVGPHSRPAEALRPMSKEIGKLQHDITVQIEGYNAAALVVRYENLQVQDRRRIAFKERLSSTTACLTTAPTGPTQVPQQLFTGIVAHLFGAIDPVIHDAVGGRIGNTNLRVDMFGDALGAAVLPGDRWRKAHDAFQNQVFLDSRFLGCLMQKEVYGLFLRFFSVEGRNAFGKLSRVDKKTQSIVPDLVTSHHPESSPLQVPGPQMWEIKRVWSVQSFARLTGEATGLSDLYRPHPRSGPMSGANRREAMISKEYVAKARRSDAKLGAPGSTAVAQALAGMAQVRGLAVGAFGEFSDTVFKLIDGLAHEGALKNPDRFGQSSYKAAYGQIHWWLKRRWARLAVITAVEARYDALCYVGGTAQQHAAARYAQAEAQDDWRFDDAFRQREEDAQQGPFFGHGAG